MRLHGVASCLSSHTCFSPPTLPDFKVLTSLSWLALLSFEQGHAPSPSVSDFVSRPASFPSDATRMPVLEKWDVEGCISLLSKGAHCADQQYQRMGTCLASPLGCRSGGLEVEGLSVHESQRRLRQLQETLAASLCWLSLLLEVQRGWLFFFRA